MRRIAFLPALLAACGGGAAPASAPAPAAPAPSLDAGPPASPAMEPGVRLVRDFFAPPHAYRLENGGPVTIAEPSPGHGLHGHFERTGPDGRWFRHVTRSSTWCLDVSSIDAPGPLQAGAFVQVGDASARVCEYVFTPGRYRFVLPYVAADAPEARWQVVLPFTVEGLDAAESAALVDALASRESLACDGAERRHLLRIVEETAVPEVLPRLLDLPAAPSDTFDQRLAAFEVLARLPEQSSRLVDIVEHGNAAIAVPVATALLRQEDCFRREMRCVAAVTRLAAILGARGELAPEAIEALGLASNLWPPSVPALLIERLRRARSEELRLALGHVLYNAGRERLGPHAPEAVAALQLAARRAGNEGAREAYLEMARRLAPPVYEADSSGGWRLGLSGIGSGEGDGRGPPRCMRFLERLGPLLQRRVEVTYGVSSVEPHREPILE